jgi:hypothetical protein
VNAKPWNAVFDTAGMSWVYKKCSAHGFGTIGENIFRSGFAPMGEH